MLFLHRRADTAGAQTWWNEVDRWINSAPGLVRELARCKSVVAGQVEINQTVAWARAHPAWRDDQPAFVMRESVVDRDPQGI